MANKLVELYGIGGGTPQQTLNLVLNDLQSEREGVPTLLQAALNKAPTILSDLQTIQNHGTALSNGTVLMTVLQQKQLGQDLATFAADMADVVRVFRALLVREFDPT